MKHGINTPFLVAQIVMGAAWCLLPVFLPGIYCSTVIYLFIIWCFVLASAFLTKTDNRPTLWALFGAMSIVSALYIVNINFFFTANGATPTTPFLANYDANFNWGFIISPPESFSNRSTYSFLMSFPAKFVNLDGLIAINALLTMLTLVLVARITAICCGNHHNTTALSVVLLTLVFNFLCASSIFIKDAAVCFFFVAIALGLIKIRIKTINNEDFVKPLILTILAILLVSWIRPRASLLIIPLILIFCPWKGFSGFKSYAPFLTLSIISVVAFFLIDILFNLTKITVESMQFDREYFFQNSPRGSSLSGFIMEYPLFSFWKKILLLPFTMGLQVLAPLPWTFMRHIDYGPSLTMAHFGFFWYIEFGLILYFCLYAIVRAPRTLGLLSGYSFASMASIAFFFGGTVSRYILPYIPLLIPSMVYVIQKYRNVKSFKIWMISYCLIVIIALIVGAYLYSLAPAGNDRFC